jgi:plasmid maintenance system antidote protein VapI
VTIKSSSTPLVKENGFYSNSAKVREMKISESRINKIIYDEKNMNIKNRFRFEHKLDSSVSLLDRVE